MKLRELLSTIADIAAKNNIATPMICGGAVREKVMGTLTKLDDIDITNGEASIKNLAKEVELNLGKKFSITSKTMDDGHTSVFLEGLKLDFSSNFILPNIDLELSKKGVKNPTNMMREAYSRDFTCNSLIMDFNLQKISDPTKSGIKDIQEKIIRTCISPEITLKYNLNRIIRVIYLSAKLNFSIDPSIIQFIQNNKDLIAHINPSYITNTLNKAVKYNVDKTAHTLDELDLWKELPITEALYPQYSKRFKKNSQLKRNFDYGEGFYSNMPEYKSVSDYRKKNKKKRKKVIKKIRDMKLASDNLETQAYYNGIEEYGLDNFPIVLNDDLEVNMDRKENDPAKKIEEDEEVQEDEKIGEDGGDTGETLLNPSDFSGSMYSSMHGDEGLFAFPLAEYPGHLSLDQGAVVNNDYNPIYQSNGLFESFSSEDVADLFFKLAIK